VCFAAKGGAVPGERIVGILTPGEGITIYPIHSSALTAFDDQPERWLDVRWDIDSARKELYPTQIVVTALNEPGALGVVSTTIGEIGGNIDNISFVPHATDFREMLIDLEVWDIKHLNTILSQLRGKSVVSKVERLSG
jgi:GTP pyrophosphokinase